MQWLVLMKVYITIEMACCVVPMKVYITIQMACCVVPMKVYITIAMACINESMIYNFCNGSYQRYNYWNGL